MLLSDFQYELPGRLIAQAPAELRTGSRLMVVDRKSGGIVSDRFENLNEYLSAGDCLVFNDTRVMPARLIGRKVRPGSAASTASTASAADAAAGTGAVVEALLVRELHGTDAPDNHSAPNSVDMPCNYNAPDNHSAPNCNDMPCNHNAPYNNGAPDGQGVLWEAIMRPGKRLPAGARVVFGDGLLSAEVEEVLPSGHRLLRFNICREDFFDALYKTGRIPFPPYIKNRAVDPERYQTVYSNESGSAAAPTAGLHFTREYIDALKDAGVNAAYLTLHVGPGTFAPVKTEIIEEHVMHSEFYRVSGAAAEIVNSTKAAARMHAQDGCAREASPYAAREASHCGTRAAGPCAARDVSPYAARDASPCAARAAGQYARPRVVCVGTTSIRTLESIAGDDGTISPCEGWTHIFIYPGYKFKCADALLTNFHLPGSTLLMLVCAFAGYDIMMEAYRRAVAEEYRFFSFGDAMLII